MNAKRGPGGKLRFSPLGLNGRAMRNGALTLPCGGCLGCQKEYRRQWAIRIMHEAAMSPADSSSFVTLTYDDDHLPADRSLDLRHWQLFAKKLRNALPLSSTGHDRMRFVMAGEYGDLTQRPHYHLALFNLNFQHDQVVFDQAKGSGELLYKSDTLNELWEHGSRNLIGTLTHASANYIAGYITKKVRGQAGARFYNDIDYSTGEVTASRRPPFLSMSRRPGIGQSWFDRFWRDVYPSDEVIVDGHPQKPPRYYDRLLEQREPAMWAEVKARRINEAKKYESDNTDARLDAKEEKYTHDLATRDRETQF